MPKSPADTYSNVLPNYVFLKSKLILLDKQIEVLITKLKEKRSTIKDSSKDLITDKDAMSLIHNQLALQETIKLLEKTNPEKMEEIYKKLQQNIQSIIKSVDTIENNVKKTIANITKKGTPPKKAIALDNILRGFRTLPVIKHLVSFLREQLGKKIDKDSLLQKKGKQYKEAEQDIKSDTSTVKNTAQLFKKTKLKDLEKEWSKKKELHSTPSQCVQKNL